MVDRHPDRPSWVILGLPFLATGPPDRRIGLIERGKAKEGSRKTGGKFATSFAWPRPPSPPGRLGVHHRTVTYSPAAFRADPRYAG